mmetsp:Transcript_3904/g.9476  ORF Transcript_3904/g.9476 Transcript_3904/m.9476 type:complete len:229 (+) Transcript_3904:233-919(+)
MLCCSTSRTAWSRSCLNDRIRTFAASILLLASSPIFASSSRKPASSCSSCSPTSRWRAASSELPCRFALSRVEDIDPPSTLESKREASCCLSASSRKPCNSRACSAACSSNASNCSATWVRRSLCNCAPCKCCAVHITTCCCCDRSRGPQCAMRSFLGASAVHKGWPDGPKSSTLQREMQALGCSNWRGALFKACEKASPASRPPASSSPMEATESFNPGLSNINQLW